LKTPSVLLDGETERKTEQRTALPQLELSPRKTRRKRYVSTWTKAPTHSSCEIPILGVLAKSPNFGLRTKIVLKEVESKWFKELTATDLTAVYPQSRRKIVDTIIKFSRKTLVEKGHIYPVVGGNFGIWKATQGGIDRAMKSEGKWMPKYARIFSMIEAEEEKPLNETV
jgi:hypothetical protein